MRLYDVQNQRPVGSFEPNFGEYLNSVEWSPFRPSVFATVSSTGVIYIYDMVQSKSQPAEVIKNDDLMSIPLQNR